MSKPQILIVDAHDQPVGEADIADADQQGLIRRIARLMLENSRGQVLLQKRHNDDLVYPGCWDNSVAGHVDAGESSDQAMHRETREELGIEIRGMKKAGEYYNEVHDRGYVIKKFNHLYKASYNGPIENIETEEVARVEWFGLDDLKRQIKQNPDDFTDGVKEVIKRFY